MGTATEIVYSGNANREVRETKRFAAILDDCKCMKSLCINDSKVITDEGFSYIIERLHHNLVDVNFSFTKFGPDSAMAFQNLPHLVQLNLEGTMLEDAGIMALIPKFPATLRYLNLRNSRMTDRGAFNLADALNDNLSSIEHLDMGENKKFTDIGLGAFVSKVLECTDLVGFGLDGCTQLASPIAKMYSTRKSLLVAMGAFGDYFLRRKAAVALKMKELKAKVASNVTPEVILNCDPYVPLPARAGGTKKDTMAVRESAAFASYFAMLETGMIPSAKESKPGKKKSSDVSDEPTDGPKPGETRKQLDLALLAADIRYRTRKPNAKREDIEVALRDVEILFYRERGDGVLTTWLQSDKAAKFE